MSAQLHATAVATLTGWVAPTPGQDALRRRFLAHLAAHPDGLAKACFPDHLTAGAIVVSPDGGRVLLNHHRKADAWLAFGGHLEPGDASLADGARRELVEESGLASFDLAEEPLSVDEHAVEFCSERGTVHHLDVRFLATAEPTAAHATSEESIDVRWWPVDALPATFDDMYVLVDAAVARVRSRQSTSSPGGGSSRAAAE
ncbi:NUDIX hydrolase [Nocardioides sp. zg-1228]|uniref:NUDIX hydrolase n=1 Tax=Nocardioides sp. zg-1228 TaxID=2763008 RepID=UPI0016430851|nr:NUDIX domain-containing protein [Nocardioides sp. zg-1228]MBC2933954.1 NUDIX domain-containing protein [Nocardioides sp. zg-1228]QSF58714.1 NUDIX domain-containing protein [Nocardioides sp. zg-1228]